MVYHQMIMCKIFKSPNQIAKTIFDIHKKLFLKEQSETDSLDRKLENVELSYTDNDPTIFKLKGDIMFLPTIYISSRSLQQLGYKSGNPVVITVHYRPVNIDTPFTNIDSLKHVVKGYITNLTTIFNDSGYCNKITITIAMINQYNNDIHTMEYLMKNVSILSAITFKCDTRSNYVYNTDNETEAAFTNLWHSRHRIPLLHQFMLEYNTDIKFNANHLQIDINETHLLDTNQCDFVNALNADNLLVTCVGGANTGKTQCVSSVFINGIKKDKKYLYLAPTQNLCDAFLEKFKKWNPELTNTLLLLSKKEALCQKDKYKITNIYYFTEGLQKLYNKMLDHDKDIVVMYDQCRHYYVTLRTENGNNWSNDFVKQLDDAIKNVDLAQSFLPAILIKYVKSNVFISTIDNVISGIVTPYIKNDLDYIIMDNASQVPTYTALNLLRLFPNSNICYLGDLTQLPTPNLDGILLNEHEKLLSMSILEIMTKNNFSVKHNLYFNHITHPQILRFQSCVFYNGLLQSLLREYDFHYQNLNFTDNISFLSGENYIIYPFYFFNIPHLPGKKKDTLSYELKEANNIAIFLLYAILVGISPNKIAIICLNERQVQTISTTFNSIMSKYVEFLSTCTPIPELPKDFQLDKIMNFLTICTSDIYQGRLIDYVIVSTSTSDEISNNTLTDIYELKYRICNAITRAHTGLFMFGDSEMFVENKYWKKLLDYMHMTDTICTMTEFVFDFIFIFKPNTNYYLKEFYKKINQSDIQ